MLIFTRYLLLSRSRNELKMKIKKTHKIKKRLLHIVISDGYKQEYLNARCKTIS